MKFKCHIAIRCITIPRDEQVLPTQHIILTFTSPTSTTRIKAAYLSCTVRPYIPKRIRCLKCHHYSLTKTACHRCVICARWAEVSHDDKNFENEELCANFKGDQSAFTKSCPRCLFEKEIRTIKITLNLSHPKAQKHT